MVRPFAVSEDFSFNAGTFLCHRSGTCVAGREAIAAIGKKRKLALMYSVV